MMTANTPTTSPTPVAEPVRPARDRVDGDGRTGLVLVAALVSMALMAGLNYTFSVAVMPNLADADDHTFVAITQRFNSNPVFPMTYTAPLVLTVLAVVLQRRRRPRPAVRWTVIALVFYGIVLAITAAVHIPLNYEIDDAGDPDSIADLAGVRDEFEDPWVIWNIPRTVLSIAAVAALGWSLFLQGRSTADRTARASPGRPSWAPPATTFPAASSPSAEPSAPDRSVR